MKMFQRWKKQGERAKRLRRAEELTLEGKLEPARAEMDAVLQLFPDDLETLRKSAELSAELNDAEETARRLKSLIEKNAREAAQVQNALYDDLRNAPAFQAVYRFAADALNASEEKGAAALAAEIYEAAGMFNEAHAAYEQIHAGEAEGSASAAYGKARLYAAENNPQAAAEWLLKASDAEQAHGEALSMTGVLETFESDPTFDAARNEPILQEARARLVEAKTAALETAAQEDDAGVHIRMRLIAALLNQGEEERAFQAAEAAAERFPNDLDILELRAAALLRADKTEESLEAYGEMLRLRPDHTGALIGTGAVYERLDRTDAAREAYWDALDSARGDPFASVAAARGFARIREAHGAAEALRQAADHLQPEMPVDYFEREMRSGDFDSLSGAEHFMEAAEAFEARLAQIAPSGDGE